MPNTRSAAKRLRQNLVRRERNRKRSGSMRTIIKKLRRETDHESAAKMLPEVFSRIDKTAKSGIMHRKTADRYKSRLTRYVDSLKQDSAS